MNEFEILNKIGIVTNVKFLERFNNFVF